MKTTRRPPPLLRSANERMLSALIDLDTGYGGTEDHPSYRRDGRTRRALDNRKWVVLANDWRDDVITDRGRAYLVGARYDILGEVPARKRHSLRVAS